MKITDAQQFALHIPFKNRFTHHLASRNTTESLLVALADDEGHIGYGECTPRAYVTGESLATTAGIIQDAIGALMDDVPDTVQEIAWLLDGMEALQSAPSARCALELALLDLLGKNSKCHVIDLLGGPSVDTVYYSAVITGETPETIEPVALQAAAAEVRQVKLKVGPDTRMNLENIALLRRILGEAVEIRVDANAAWPVDEAPAQIEALANAGIRYVEQPLAPAAREQWLLLKSRIAPEIRIFTDESVCTQEDALWLAKNAAVSGFNLKVSKHGGILATLEVHQIARQYGLLCQLGCHVGETSLLSAAGRIVALVCGDLRACEGSYGLLLLETDLTATPLQAGFRGIGTLDALRAGHGLGVNVALDRIADYSVRI